MTEAEFFKRMSAFLISAQPNRDHGNLTPDANLWEMGYITSLSAVELILFVETLISRHIIINDIKTFDSIRNIYAHYVQQVADPE
jgi:acyl carrier protein